MTNEAASEGTVQEFLSSVPLYQQYVISRDIIEDVYQNRHGPVDLYCPACKSHSIFTRSGTYHSDPPDAAHSSWIFQCRRNTGHTLTLNFIVRNNKLLKYGQYPSLADIALGELGPLKKALKNDESREFTKAIGLAAHGVGIGSFVYLRRIFENLIQRRFNAFSHQIDAEQFAKARMVEKIELLRDHLPSFMVENRSIYGILSKGIHTLSDDMCREAFPMMRDSIMMILEEDAREIEQKRKREELSRSISSLGSFLAQADQAENSDDSEGT